MAEFINILSALIIFCGFLSPSNGVVVQLDSTNFDETVNGDRHVLVEFYAPWCGHCKRLAPAYETVGTAFDSNDNVVIAKVDADSERSLGSRFGVKGFPTLKFFPKGSTEPEDYTSGRDADSMIKFINEKANTKGSVKKSLNAVKELDDANFDAVVLDESKNVLVEFYAPWCGHCKALAPIYEEVAATFIGDENCVVANIDADGNQGKASQFEITGYPTIKFFSTDNKEGEEYSGGRTTEDFVRFLNDKCGTSRLPGGKLSDTAGLVDSMHSFVEDFMDEVDARADIVAQAEAAIEKEASSFASYYVKVMRKVLDKGNEYITNEYDRLGRILSGNISIKKLDELTKKRNILKKFEL